METGRGCGRWLYIAVAAVAVAAGVALYAFDPMEKGVFPRCPFLMLTGLECPGCGSQRALHALLHGDVRAACGFNPLMVVAMPYLLLGFVAEVSFRRWRLMRAVRERLYSGRAVWSVAAVIAAFWIGRNVM